MQIMAKLSRVTAASKSSKHLAASLNKVLPLMLVATGMMYAQQAPSGAKLSAEQISKYKSYKSELIKRADANDQDAQYSLGLLYEFPQDGARANRSGAAYWFKRAADQGNLRAMYRLGLYYYDQGDDTNAYASFQKGATAGFPPAMTKFGEMIMERNVGAHGLEWWLKAAQAGDPDAQNDLGQWAWTNAHMNLAQETGHTPAEWFTMAAAAGSCEAAANLGGVYFNGVGVTQNAAVADEAFKKAESCVGAPAWVIEKAHHFRGLIAAHRLPDPSLSMPLKTPSSRLDIHEDRTASIVAGVIALVGVAALLQGQHHAAGESSAATSTSDDQSDTLYDWAARQRQNSITGGMYCAHGLSYMAASVAYWCPE